MFYKLMESSSTKVDHIDGVMVSVLTSNAVNCGLETCSGQTKYYETGICCFSPKYAALEVREKTGCLGIMMMIYP
jgi:hypothetical protein